MTVQYSVQKMVSDGTLSTIALGIQYLQRNDIYMRIAGEETPQSGAPSGYTWSFLDNTTLKILPVVPNGVEVVVYRRTDVDAMYNIYSQNAQFDEATIDENNQQLLYIAQEYLEQGLPGAGVDTIEFLRDDGTNTYYRIKRTDGSYSDEFAVPSASSSTKVLTREALRRSYAEAGYNLVDGSFEAGGTLVNANDVLLQERTGKAYSWLGIGQKEVPAGSTPASTGGFGVTAWNAMAANGKREISYLEDYLPDLLGVTDYSDIVQRVVDTSNIVLFGKGRCKISTVNWPKKATVIGMGQQNSVFVVSDNVDIFNFPAGGRFSDFSIEITNSAYTKDILKIATSYLAATTTGRENDDRVNVRNISVRAMSVPAGAGSLNCNTIKLLADANDKGVYKHVLDNIDMHQCGRPVDIETTGVNAWVNSNFITNCAAFATNGVVKIRNNGTNSEIRDNTIDVNFQNNVNVPGVETYDIPTSFSIKDNKLSGYLWDLFADASNPNGCRHGNAGMNFTAQMVTTNSFFNGLYLYLGSLSNNEGTAFVDLSISRYAQFVDKLKIAVVAGVPQVRYHHTEQALGLDFRYQKINNIFYIFMKSTAAYLDVGISNQACFSNGMYSAALASVPNSFAMPMPASRKPVTANSAGAITGFDMLLSMTDKLTVGEITDISQIPIGGNERGLTAFLATGTSIGLTAIPESMGCLFYDKGNSVGVNNRGSNLIAFSHTGNIYIRTYQDGWLGWQKVTLTAVP